MQFHGITLNTTGLECFTLVANGKQRIPRNSNLLPDLYKTVLLACHLPLQSPLVPVLLLQPLVPTNLKRLVDTASSCHAAAVGKIFLNLSEVCEVWWPNGYCPGTQIGWPGFKLWPGSRHSTLMVLLSTEVYKWVLTN